MSNRILLVTATLILGTSSIATLGQGPATSDKQAVTEQPETLRMVQSYEFESLKGVVGLAVSSDGRFLYAPAYQTATMHVFSIDPTSGRLELLETDYAPTSLSGATDFCLSPDGKLGLTSAFGSKAATLFRRDSETGKLTKLNVIDARSEGVTGFQWPIRGTFSSDGKFVYVVDSGLSNNLLVRNAPAVLVFEIVDDNIKFVESFYVDGIANGRGIAVHPNGKHVFVAASNGQSLVLLRRHSMTGKLELVKVMRDEPGQTKVLDGAMAVQVDSSGKYVYTLSGRFRGTGGVGVFAFDPNKEELTFLEAHLCGSVGLEQFEGGNQLALSPDGKRLYATGTSSGTLSTFERNFTDGKLIAAETTAFRRQWKGSVAGVAVTPDSRFVYVSGAESDPSITVFEVQP